MHCLFHLTRGFTRFTFISFIASSALSLQAQTMGGALGSGSSSATRLDEVVVLGRATDLVGTAGAASEGSVGYIELEVRPFLRRGELLEVIPGVVITQHSGAGKANQYFLRGFNLDHGTDFSMSVDGMPVNMRSHGHGQGYADLNFIIPEFVQSVDYNKGPFAAEVGDFSSAGAARFNLFKTLPRDFVTLEAGENNYGRLVAGTTLQGGATVATTVGFEATHDDGPWQLEEDLRRYSAIMRHLWTGPNGQEFALTALGYTAEWSSTDQVPLRAVEIGLIDRLGYIDPSDGGETQRASLSFDWVSTGADAVTQINAYALYYRLNLFSNFSYFLDDPVDGDQFNQRDRRGVFGLNVERSSTHNWFGKETEAKLGVQLRDDLIGELGLHHSARRVRLETVRNDDVHEASAGIFYSETTQWSKWARTKVGLRGDVYYFDVDSDNAANSGTRVASIASPKLALALGPWKKTEIYFNAGLGFHSNDARGTTIRIDPSDDATPVDRVHPLVRSRGFETGVRTSFLPGLVSTVSIWSLDLDSELVFVGDAGGTEPSGATRRHGIEFANFYKVTPWLTVDADVSFTHARYREDAPNDRIANSISTVVTAGVVAGHANGWFGSIRLRHFGEQPLIEDNTVVAPSSTTVNVRFGWKNREWEVAVSVLNVFHRKNSDIAYWYPSRLPGESLDGIEDVHFHPGEPRTVRISLTRRF